MKKGDFYRHFKGVEYTFYSIALPTENRKLESIGTARYHEDTHDINLYMYDGITFIDSELPHVIYQAEKDYDTDYVYARELDDFFGFRFDSEKDLYEKRFQKIIK
jgi:hypothetical protein